MQKQAPTLGRLLVMVGFALSCFGLLLFLWLSFGGPVPLMPKGYRVHASFSEATTFSSSRSESHEETTAPRRIGPCASCVEKMFDPTWFSHEAQNR